LTYAKNSHFWANFHLPVGDAEAALPMEIGEEATAKTINLAVSNNNRIAVKDCVIGITTSGVTTLRQVSCGGSVCRTGEEEDQGRRELGELHLEFLKVEIWDMVKLEGKLKAEG